MSCWMSMNSDAIAGAVDGEAVAVRLLLVRVVRARLPVDQGAVAVEGDEARILG